MGDIRDELGDTPHIFPQGQARNMGSVPPYLYPQPKLRNRNRFVFSDSLLIFHFISATFTMYY